MRVGRLLGQRAKARFSVAALLAVLVALLTLAVTPAALPADRGGKCRSPVIPPTSRWVQRIYGCLALEWSQWYVETPAAVNPVLDETGENAAQGQDPRSPVFFLAGSSGYHETVREVTVPRGKFLFFPIINYVGWAPVDGETEEEVRATANFFMDLVTELECTIDGRPVQNLLLGHRVESPCGSFGPNDMAYGDPEADPPIPDAYDGGDILLADGYWVLLAPLSKGPHLIEFSAALGPAGEEPWFWLDVTYLLTVAPKRARR